MYEAHIEREKAQLETMAHVISVGVNNAMNKKKITVFQKEKSNFVGSETNQETMEYLRNTFTSERR